jgi:hypothetical protein
MFGLRFARALDQSVAQRMQEERAEGVDFDDSEARRAAVKGREDLATIAASTVYAAVQLSRIKWALYALVVIALATCAKLGP